MDNSNLKEELAKVDERIAMYQKQVDLGKMLEEMHEDPKFIAVIIEAYFDAEAKRIFELLVEPSTLSREKLENLDDKLAAIRNFKIFFKQILINANMAPMQIEEENTYRAELTAQDSIIDVDVEEG